MDPDQLDVIKMMIEYGGDLHAKDRYGVTPLDYFDEKTREELLKFAEEHGSTKVPGENARIQVPPPQPVQTNPDQPQPESMQTTELSPHQVRINEARIALHLSEHNLAKAAAEDRTTRLTMYVNAQNLAKAIAENREAVRALAEIEGETEPKVEEK